eukprot:Em0003g1082a
MDKQKQTFEEFCKDTFMDGDSKGSKTIYRAKGEKIIRLLKKEMNDYTPKFRHWFKSKGFQLISHSAQGLKDVLCIPAKTSNPNDTTILFGWRRIAFVEDFYDVIHGVHATTAEVALNLQNQVFSYLGTPKILHSDNDPEFVNAIVASLCKEWPGLVKSLLSMAAQEILSARALLSRGMGQWRKCWVFVSLNLTQILLLGQNGSPLFSVRCSIAYHLNTTLHGVMKTIPYELVFGQPPRQSVFPGAKYGSNIMEEDLEDIINDHLPSKSDDQPSSKSDDQPPFESDDQPPSISDTQHFSKSHAQDVSESDD